MCYFVSMARRMVNWCGRPKHNWTKDSFISSKCSCDYPKQRHWEGHYLELLRKGRIALVLSSRDRAHLSPVERARYSGSIANCTLWRATQVQSTSPVLLCCQQPMLCKFVILQTNFRFFYFTENANLVQSAFGVEYNGSEMNNQSKSMATLHYDDSNRSLSSS